MEKGEARGEGDSVSGSNTFIREVKGFLQKYSSRMACRFRWNGAMAAPTQRGPTLRGLTGGDTSKRTNSLARTVY